MNNTVKYSYIAERIAFSEKAAVDALTNCGHPVESKAARAAARVAVLNSLPHLKTPEDTQAYIACVAWAVGQTLIKPTEGSKLLYAAQCAMANRANCVSAVL